MIENVKEFAEDNLTKVKNFIQCTLHDFKNVWLYKPNVLIWCAVAVIIALIY